MDGHFTEDRAVWKNELQRHCDEVYGEAEMQKDRIMKFKTADANHVTEDWARMAQEKGPCAGRLNLRGDDQGAPTSKSV